MNTLNARKLYYKQITVVIPDSIPQDGRAGQYSQKPEILEITSFKGISDGIPYFLPHTEVIFLEHSRGSKNKRLYPNSCHCTVLPTCLPSAVTIVP